MEKNKGAREPGTSRGTTRFPEVTASEPPTLADIGVTKKQSFGTRWHACWSTVALTHIVRVACVTCVAGARIGQTRNGFAFSPSSDAQNPRYHAYMWAGPVQFAAAT